MKNSRNQYIAVAAGLGLMGYLFFSGPLMSFFSTSSQNQNNQMPETGYKVEEVVAGQGELAEPGDKLTVHYVGTLPNGPTFSFF